MQVTGDLFRLIARWRYYSNWHNRYIKHNIFLSTLVYDTVTSTMVQVHGSRTPERGAIAIFFFHLRQVTSICFAKPKIAKPWLVVVVVSHFCKRNSTHRKSRLEVHSKTQSKLDLSKVKMCSRSTASIYFSSFATYRYQSSALRYCSWSWHYLIVSHVVHFWVVLSHSTPSLARLIHLFLRLLILCSCCCAHTHDHAMLLLKIYR